MNGKKSKKAGSFLLALLISGCATTPAVEFTDDNEEKWEDVPECGPTKVIGFKEGEVTDNDIRSLARAEKVCHDRYDSCLKVFTKKGFQEYTAICGK